MAHHQLTSRPGHPYTMIQVLTETIRIDSETEIILDAMCKQCNIADYSGDIVPESAVTECINQAEKLLRNFKKWLTATHPELLSTD